MIGIGRREVLTGLTGGILAMAAHAETPSRGGTLTVGLSNDSKTYDPIFSVQYSERYVLYLAFDTLVKYGPDFSIRPELAESWETSPTARRSTPPRSNGISTSAWMRRSTRRSGRCWRRSWPRSTSSTRGMSHSTW
jgi:ABC-type transport system substrate-binding protein